MRRPLFLTLLALCLWANVARAQSYVLVVKSATIAGAKACGCCWDCGFTITQTWPDPYVIVRVYDGEELADYGQTFVDWNTFTPQWSQERATVKAGWSVWLQVWDKDVKYDDEIGSHCFYVTEDMLKKGEVSLKFGEVENITLVFRPTKKPANDARVLLFQPYPGPNSAKNLTRTKDRDLAVVLLHGLDLRDDGSSPYTPRPHDWQSSTSPLVRALSKDADVFALCYTQTAAVEDIAALSEMRDSVKKIKDLGYQRVVLLGHSAGGLIARHIVEDHPSAGVTSVIQVATPNAGARLAECAVKLAQVRREQAAFVRSLSPDHRASVLKARQARAIPKQIEFVAVVSCGETGTSGDSVVSCKSQWPDDLQDQCVPCVCVQATHLDVLDRADCVAELCKLVTQPQSRWATPRVNEARERLRMTAR